MTKKIFLFLLFLFFIGSATIFFLLHQLGPWNAASFLPLNTTAFIEFSDLPRTAQRWQQSLWGKLEREKSIQEFCQKPREVLSQKFRTATALPNATQPTTLQQYFQALKPGRLFFASVPEPEGESWILGCQFFGNREGQQQSLEAFHRFLDQQWGTGTRGAFTTEEAPGMTISYATHGTVTLYSAIDHSWIFISNSQPTLLQSLQLEQKKDPTQKPLASSSSYRQNLHQVLSQADLLCYGGTQKVFSLFPFLSSLLGTPELTTKIDSFLLSWRFTQKGIQEKDFLAGNFPQQPTITHQGGSLAPDNSVALLERSNQWEELLKTIQNAPNIPASTKQLLAPKGIDFGWLSSLISPTTTFVAYWDQELGPPSFLLSLFGSSPEQLHEWMLEASHHFGFLLENREDPPFQFVAFPHTGPNIALTFGLSGTNLLIGTSPQGVENGFARILPKKKKKKEDSPSLIESHTFHPYRKLYQKATLSFTYLDLPAILDHLYPPLRHYWQEAGLAEGPLAPLADYLDPTSFPPSTLLKKYLTPIVGSQHQEKNGIISFSEGPITLNMLWLLGNLLYTTSPTLSSPLTSH